MGGPASIWLTWIRQFVRDSQEKETLELELAGVEVSGAKVLDCWGRVSACVYVDKLANFQGQWSYTQHLTNLTLALIACGHCGFPPPNLSSLVP